MNSPNFPMIGCTLLLLFLGSNCFAQSGTAANSTENHKAGDEAAISAFEDAIEAGDDRFSTRLNLARSLATVGDADRAISELHGLLNSGYNPVDSVLNSKEFESVRLAPNYESLRQRLEPCLGGVYGDFKFTVGTWEIFNNANAGNDTDKSIISTVADGCAMHERYWTAYGYQAESFKAYDDVKQKWTMLVVDNQGFFLNFTQAGNNEGNDITLEARDDTAIYRATTTKVDNNTFRTVWLRSRDGGSSWSSYVDSEYHRVKQPLAENPE